MLNTPITEMVAGRPVRFLPPQPGIEAKMPWVVLFDVAAAVGMPPTAFVEWANHIREHHPHTFAAPEVDGVADIAVPVASAEGSVRAWLAEPTAPLGWIRTRKAKSALRAFGDASSRVWLRMLNDEHRGDPVLMATDLMQNASVGMAELTREQIQ